MSGLNYFSNFDSSSFDKRKTRDFTRTIDDPCYMQQEQLDNSKKLKFITTNHIDLLEAKDKLNFYGMTIKDKLFVPSENMDSDSFLRYGKNGGIMTNCNVKNEYGQLPLPTVPSKYQLSHGDVDIEDSMRFLIESNRKSCHPIEKDFHNRSFYLFDDKLGIETPNPIKSIEAPELFGPRGGISSRFSQSKRFSRSKTN